MNTTRLSLLSLVLVIIMTTGVLAVQPFGVSTALELGWAVGAGKHTILLLSEPVHPELMVKRADHICTTFQEVLEILSK